MTRWIVFILTLALAGVTAEAASLRKLSEVKRGKIGAFAISSLFQSVGDLAPQIPSGLFVTAVRDEAGELKLFVWANAETTPRATAGGGAISAVAVAPLRSKRFVTAVRDSDGRLRVIAWAASEDGRSVARVDTAVGPHIRSEIAAAGGDIESTSPNADPLAVIVTRRANGDLYITYARLRGDRLTLDSGATFGGADKLAVATHTGGNAIAMRDDEGRLRLTHVSRGLIAHKDRVFRGATALAGAVSDVAVDQGLLGAFPAGLDKVVTFTADAGPTGVRTGLNCNGRLLLQHGHGKLILWDYRLLDVDAAAGVIKGDFQRAGERAFAGTGGIAKAVALTRLRRPPRNFKNSEGSEIYVTGHLGFGDFCKLLERDRGKPHAEFHVWEISIAGIANRATAHLGGDYTDIQLAEIASGDDAGRFAVALRGAAGDLKVAVWEVVR